MTSDIELNLGALLPNGLLDALPERAEQEMAVVAQLLESFARFGYRQVNPPLVEFEESLTGGNGGEALAKNTFRMMDPVSRRMMAVRADATTQIVRIAASRLSKAPRPLRLSYVADVLRVKASQLRPERQFRQVGCEMIGKAGADAAAETALLAVCALDVIGVPKISIDFTAPEIIRTLAEKIEDRENFIAICQRRDDDALKKFGEAGKMLVRLNECSGEAKQFFKKIKSAKLSPALKASFSNLEQVVKKFSAGLDAYGLTDKVTITVDPLETRGFEYESSPSFTLFAPGVRGELGRGGFYEAAFKLSARKMHREPANGFTLYLDSLLRSIPKPSQALRIAVPETLSWVEIKKLQHQGYAVVRLGAKLKLDESGCTHLLKNNKITKL